MLLDSLLDHRQGEPALTNFRLHTPHVLEQLTRIGERRLERSRSRKNAWLALTRATMSLFWKQDRRIKRNA